MVFKSFCANRYCCPLWFNSTSSSIRKLKTSYNSAFGNLLMIKKPYSASTMFVTHGIPSFYELFRTSILKFVDHVSKNSSSIIMACVTPIDYIHCPIRQWWRSVLYLLALFYFVIFYYYYYYHYDYCTYISFNIFLHVYGPSVCNKDILLLLLFSLYRAFTKPLSQDQRLFI